MAANSPSTVDKIKLWLFPSLTALCMWFGGSMLNDIRKDLDAVKSDVKTLLSQSNIDKTRIDNLERQVARLENKVLYTGPGEDNRQRVSFIEPAPAILPDQKGGPNLTKYLPKRSL